MSGSVNPDDWGDVYYDSETGEFVTINVTDDDSVIVSEFSGVWSSEVSVDEFQQDVVPALVSFDQTTVETPEETILRALGNCYEHGWIDNDIELQFAMEHTKTVREFARGKDSDGRDIAIVIPLVNESSNAFESIINRLDDGNNFPGIFLERTTDGAYTCYEEGLSHN